MTTKPMKNDMPRGPRLDVPGTLHHVILRGIERGVIFQDDADRTEFLRRFGELSKASVGTRGRCTVSEEVFNSE